MMKLTSEDYKYLVILILSTLIIHHQWIFNFDILTSGDVIYFFKETSLDYFNIPSLWICNDQFGAPSIVFATFPIYFLYGLFAHLGFEYSIGLRILFCYIIVIAPIFSMYILTKNLSKSTLIAIISSIAFSYSIYFLFLQSIHLNLAVADSLVPLELYLFIEGLLRKSYRLICAASILNFIIGIYDFRIAYINIFLLTIYLLIYLTLSSRSLESLRSSIKLFFIFIILFITYNTYWLLPLISMQKVSSNVYFDRGLFGNQFFNILTALTSFHPFWTGSTPSIFIIQPIPIYIWLIPILSFVSLLLIKKDLNLFYFAVIALLGVILTKQSGPPFTELYSWLYYHFPGFNAFREASKFYLLTILSYSILIGYTTFIIKKYLSRKSGIISLIFILSVLSLFCYNTLPLLTGNIKNVFEPKVIPDDYISIRDQLISDTDYYRTFWIPHSNRFSFFSDLHPRIEAFDVVQNDWTYMFKNDDYRDPISTVSSLVASNYSDFLFDSASIRYIFLPYDNYDEIYSKYGGEKNDYSEILNSSIWVKCVDKNLSRTIIYENENYYPRIYIPRYTYIIRNADQLNELLKNYDGRSTTAIIFQKDALKSDICSDINVSSMKMESRGYTAGGMNPFIELRNPKEDSLISNFTNKYMASDIDIISNHNFEHTIRLSNVREPFILVLGENFDANWKFYNLGYRDTISSINLIDYFSILFEQFLPEKNHILINGYANAWYVDPDELHMNKTATIRLYYLPQSYAIIGIIITGGMLILTVFFIFIVMPRCVRHG